MGCTYMSFLNKMHTDPNIKVLGVDRLRKRRLNRNVINAIVSTIITSTMLDNGLFKILFSRYILFVFNLSSFLIF